jgi:NADP-dependent 3-hydroxy acid dehydrogenase YdfG
VPKVQGDGVSAHVAIVAGAGGALGHATTPARAARGRTVVAVDPNENALRDLPDDIRRAVADTTDPQAIDACELLGAGAARNDVFVLCANQSRHGWVYRRWQVGWPSPRLASRAVLVPWLSPCQLPDRRPE